MGRPARFYFDEARDLLVLETGARLSAVQRRSAALFALNVYRDRYRAMPPGHRRDIVGRVVQKLLDVDFVERPNPRFDCERDVIAY